MPSLADELGLEPPRFLSRKCLHKISAFLLYNFFLLFFSITDHSQLRVNRSLSCCRVRVGHGASLTQCELEGLIKYLCLSQSSNTVLTLAGWLSAPMCPLGKFPCVEWMLQTSAVTESHWWRSTIHQALRRKKLWATEWTFKMMNVCSRLT